MRSGAPRKGPRALPALCALLLAELIAAVALAPSATAFDPGQVASTANDPAFNLSAASDFRLHLDNLEARAWPGSTVNESQDVHIAINGSDRLTGTQSEVYHIDVSGVPSFTQNYTTIAVVLKGNTSDVVLQPDATAERTGSEAYTKDLNGSSSMSLTLLPANRTGSLTMWVFGYVGNGNRTTHGDDEVYALEKKDIEMRASRLIPVNVTVANDANVTVTGVLVSFFAKGPHDADFALIGNASVGAVGAKSSADAGVVWDATWADPALYTMKAVVDPLHAHADAFEDNNVIFFEVNLGPPAPPPSELASQLFLWSTVAIIGAIAVGLWWYNRVYE